MKDLNKRIDEVSNAAKVTQYDEQMINLSDVEIPVVRYFYGNGIDLKKDKAPTRLDQMK